MMYSCATPTISDDSDTDNGNPDFDDKLDANNPNNFNQYTDEEVIV